MNKPHISFFVFIIFEILVVFLGILLAIAVHNHSYKFGYEAGYKAACGDFYQGHLKYDLITNPDGTREWKKIK